MKEVLVYLSIIHKGNWDKIYKDILDKVPVDKDKVKEVTENLNNQYVTIIDENYPECLKYIFKPPFVLYYKGNLSLLSDKRKKIAVIGSRNNSEYGKAVTEKICKDLVEHDTIIVSGLAKGIDSIAHLECLKNHGKTIAVLGNGLNIIYPENNASLYEKISCEGLIISEYPFGCDPSKENFPNRNRIIAGICDGVAVMEANVKSGTMNTVSHALEDGKLIFCVPDTIFMNSGCNKLIKEGAKLIENGVDILEEF